MQGLSKENLSFGLSATSQHQQGPSANTKQKDRKAVSPYDMVRVGEWMRQEEKLLARNIMQEIENA